jgi:predicted nucleotidyltransferase
VLVTLAQLTAPMTVRALARHAHVAPQSALGYVNELAASGIVLVQQAGTALLVSLNRQHLVSDPLVALATLRARLVERLRAELSQWRGLAAAWLFGSAARGDGDVQSDIDILLVAEGSTAEESWADATASLRERVREWTGNEGQFVEHTRSSFTRLVDANDPLLRAVRDEGIPLTSNTTTLLRRPA